MASASGTNVHDDHGHGAQDLDHAAAAHDAHDAHDDHEDHGSGGDAWVIPPLVVGLVIGLIIAVIVGLQSGASPFN